MSGWETDRLKSRVRVQALIRHFDRQNIPAVVRRSGDDDAGALLIVIDRREGDLSILSEVRNLDGALEWSERRLAENENLPEILEKQVDFDPDIWIIDIDDPDSRVTIDGIVV
ncbi:MAG: DUF1491 family protein [Rhodospirillales bacterium]|nr:DUF1491 family protein [Rhodospirillales bacterium]